MTVVTPAGKLDPEAGEQTTFTRKVVTYRGRWIGNDRRSLPRWRHCGHVSRAPDYRGFAVTYGDGKETVGGV